MNKKKKNDESESIPYLPLTEECKKKIEEQRAEHKESAKKNVRKMKDMIAHSKNEHMESVKRAIRNAYWESWDKLPSVWVARDDDGSLWIYTTKPKEAGGMFCCGATGDFFQIDDSVYPEITHENSPVKVKLLFIDA